MKQFSDDDIVLKHALPTRIFHWCLVCSFLPAAFTGIILFLRPFSNNGMHLTMQVHIVSAWVLCIACLLFLVFQFKRVIVFCREIFSWSKNDIKWMMLCGGYPQKIFLGRTIEVPPMRKMNSGQKFMGIIVAFGTIIMIITGLVLYIALPEIPKEIAFVTDRIHLVAGVLLTVCVCCGHMVLGIYNWNEFKCMFGDGTTRINKIKEHNELWVEYDIEPVKSNAE